jgi:uncharacterized protein (DUF3084 family)
MIQVLVLLLVSAIIAYVGDWLGTAVGKRRISLFGLRPRVTAIIITISTGILITLLTLLTASLLSDNVKIALFSVQQLKTELADLQAEREKIQADISQLKQQIRVKEQEAVVYRKDAILTAIVIRHGQPAAAISQALVQFIQTLRKNAEERGLQVKPEKEMLAENQEQFRQMAEHIAQAKEDLVLVATSVENRNAGEPLGQVKFGIRPNPLIFSAGDEIGTLEIDGADERGQIAKTLQEFMQELNHEIVKMGMVGNPLTKQFGDFSSESLLSFYDMVNQIKKMGRKITLVTIVTEDTFAAGPLNVNFRLDSNADSDPDS